MNNKSRTRRRISPQIVEEQPIPETLYFQHEKRCKLGDLDFIRKAFCAVSYDFPSPNEQSTLGTFLKRVILEHIVTFILIFYIIGDTISIISSVDHLPIGLLFSATITDFCIISIRLLLLYKRKVIISTLEYLLQTHSKFQTRRTENRKLYILVGFCTCFVIPTAFFSQTVELCFTDELLKSYVEDSFFGWSSQENWINCAALTGLDVVVMNQKYTFPGFTIVLCCYVFGLLRRILESFAVSIEEKDDFRTMFDFFSKNSQKILRCIQQVENSFSLLLLLNFGYMLCSIFSVSTILIRLNPADTDMKLVIPHYISLVLVLAAFYITSVRATAVHEKAVEIKDCIHKMVAEKATLKHSLSPEEQCLLLSMASEFPSRIVITGWDLFTLNRHFIRRTAGGIITYGMLLSQIDK
ncbi:uncharacterized protein TNIN_376141 [Trichonephila inaurata madagascariensis]|uniref:Uncharacterized protein n=1 Tax=Trichonephila inaurata madagascariensis TaxID=2747483 RepID=A0A8X7CJS2_9ARAC|nr:uncharacterized protein TNIN_376141 [Trichonephila inaurata madagascariensis]